MNFLEAVLHCKQGRKIQLPGWEHFYLANNEGILTLYSAFTGKEIKGYIPLIDEMLSIEWRLANVAKGTAN